MKLRDYIQESLSKEYHYTVKIAGNCNDEHTAMLEKCLQKYKFITASKWKRLPIQENPVEFVQLKGARFISEVCSADVTLGYPVNNRILEVYLAVNMNIDFSHIIVYGLKEARKVSSDDAATRQANDIDRQPNMDDAKLVEDDYSEEKDSIMYGEAFNEEFLAELARIKAEKGEDYFRRYPTKDQIMGDVYSTTINDYWGTPNMGVGVTGHKEVSINNQNLNH